MSLTLMSLAGSALGLTVPQSRFLRPVRHLQLAEDVGDMVAHGFEGEAQLLGDLPLAEFWKDPAGRLAGLPQRSPA